MTPLLGFTRGVYVLGVCLTAGTGAGLFAIPARTADYWAWTIRAPLTAAFFGAGYIGAATALGLAARSGAWEPTRVVAVAALALTSVALFVTLRNLDQFAFGRGGLPEAVAWVWLVVYAVLPPAVLTAFVRQWRAGGIRGDDAPPHALPLTRVVLGGAGAALGLLGIALLANAGWLTRHWPWPLPALPAGIAGAWLCSFAGAFLWFALRERSWARARLGVVPAMIALLLYLIAGARLHDGFRGSASTTVYLGSVGSLLVLVGASALVEERRLRGQRDAGSWNALDVRPTADG